MSTVDAGAEDAFVEHALGQRRLEIFRYIHPLMIVLDFAAIVWFLRFPAVATARRLEHLYMFLNVIAAQLMEPDELARTVDGELRAGDAPAKRFRDLSDERVYFAKAREALWKAA